MFQFPANPLIGDIFTPVTGVSFRWNGTGWVPYSAVALTKTEADTLYAPIGSAPGNNRIINGSFRIDQRLEGGVYQTLGTGVYGPDMWFANGAGSGNLYLQRADDSFYLGEYILAAQVNVADASLAAGDSYNVQTCVEGYNCGDLNYGGPSAQPITISFEVVSNITGPYSLSIRNNLGNRSYVTSFTVNVAGAVEKKVITIPGDTGGAWNHTNDIGLSITIGLGIGSTYQAGSANTWLTGNYLTLAGMTNLMASVSNYLTLRRFKLEKGSYATPFEPRSFKDELELCQRYYEKSYDVGVTLGTVTLYGSEAVRGVAGTANLLVNVRYKTKKRADPTNTFYSPNTGTAAKVYNSSTGDVTVTAESNPGMAGSPQIVLGTIPSAGDAIYYHWVSNARLT